MSKEIKFRVWNKAKNDWEFGYKTMGGVNLFGEVHVMGYFNIPLQELNNYEAMQYTGLKDKNGKEIYEDDIVNFTNDSSGNEVCKVSFGEYITEGCIDCGGDYAYGFYIDSIYIDSNFNKVGLASRRVEVIGNIYENSELIKK